MADKPDRFPHYHALSFTQRLQLQKEVRRAMGLTGINPSYDETELLTQCEKLQRERNPKELLEVIKGGKGR